jgi:hypothetical protein
MNQTKFLLPMSFNVYIFRICYELTSSINIHVTLVFQEQSTGNKRTRPLYDVPYMFEAREFMRKKLIGKKVLQLCGLNDETNTIMNTKYSRVNHVKCMV